VAAPPQEEPKEVSVHKTVEKEETHDNVEFVPVFIPHVPHLPHEEKVPELPILEVKLE